MSDLLLILALLAVLVLAPILLLARRRRPVPAAPTPAPRAGLSFQRPVIPVSKAAEMQDPMADRPPMFANSPTALEGEIAPDRLPSS